MTGRIIVNGRFLRAPTTGVQRYARELTRRLQTHTDRPVHVAVPGRGLVPADELRAELAATAVDPLGGGRAHAWQQVQLPRLVDRGDVLLSLCNIGPLAVRRQLVVIHDTGPFIDRAWHGRAYGAMFRLLVPQLIRRVETVATVSTGSQHALQQRFGIHAQVVPNGVGAPFLRERPTDVPDGAPRRVLFVGAHDPRKGLDRLLTLWPELHARHGISLDIVGRSAGAVFDGPQMQSVEGATWHVDPDDAHLAGLYAKATLVLSPSHYEGFGLPLLEGLGAGTPFLSTPTGAAEELAVDTARQVRPFERSTWLEAITSWTADADERRASHEVAMRYSWDAAAERLAEVVDGCFAGRP